MVEKARRRREERGEGEIREQKFGNDYEEDDENEDEGTETLFRLSIQKEASRQWRKGRKVGSRIQKQKDESRKHRSERLRSRARARARARLRLGGRLLAGGEGMG